MRRTTAQTLLALLLALLFAAPVDAVTPGGAAEDTLTGILEQVIVENPDAGRSHEEYSLRTSRGVFELRFADGGPDGLGGATVTVTGRRAGMALDVATSRPGRSLRVIREAPSLALGGSPVTVEALDGTGTLTSAATTDATAEGTTASPVAKSFALILINFTDLKTQPFTKSAAQAALTGSSGSLKAFYEEESKGRMTVTGTAYGWYTIDATTTGCDWRAWHTLAYNAAAAAGVNFASFSNVIFAWPQTNQCGFAGVAYVPGVYSYLNGTLSVQVMSHEVGHNFGLGHANASNCVVNGTRVTIAAASACTTKTYADPFSTMGNNAARHNHGSQLGELGWLDGSEVVTGAPGNSYTITPYFATGGTKLVRVPRGDGTFFDLDYRKTYGSFDNFAAGSPAVSGATIRIGKGTATPTRTPQATELLDTTPATTDLKDAPLLVGRTITDPVSTISFTTMSVSSSAVTVRVREGIAPGAPGFVTATGTAAPGVDLAWGAASDNVAVTGYQISRDGSVVTTTGAAARAWTDTAVAAGTTHTYAVAAVDGSGNAGPAATATATVPGNPAPTPTPDPSASPTPTPTPDPSADPGGDVQAPTEPAPLTGEPAITTVTLSWGQATDDTGVAGYRISRNGTPIATATGTTWQDTGRKPLTSYTYSVVALDGAGNASAASQLSVRTRADTVRPSTPLNFRKVKRSGGYVTFAWSPASDNVKVVKYRIYRVGRSKPIATTTNTRIRIWTRRGAWYYVRAFDAAGNRSAASRGVRGRS